MPMAMGLCGASQRFTSWPTLHFKLVDCLTWSFFSPHKGSKDSAKVHSRLLAQIALPGHVRTVVSRTAPSAEFAAKVCMQKG
eukprot:5827631-Amphidinium_carterae.1